MTDLRIRVLVVDDHAVVREGIRAVVSADPAFEVVAEASDGDEALRIATRLRPDVVILDLSMPGEGGLATAGRLKDTVPETKVLILSVYDHPEYVLQSVRVGALGYLRKDTSPAELRDAIRALHRGESFFSPRVARQLSTAVRSESRKEERETKADRLTGREREVLVGIAAGRTSKEIARALGLSSRTVESYRESLMRKLDIRTVAGLTRFAMEAGLGGET